MARTQSSHGSSQLEISTLKSIIMIAAGGRADEPGPPAEPGPTSPGRRPSESRPRPSGGADRRRGYVTTSDAAGLAAGRAAAAATGGRHESEPEPRRRAGSPCGQRRASVPGEHRGRNLHAVTFSDGHSLRPGWRHTAPGRAGPGHGHRRSRRSADSVSHRRRHEPGPAGTYAEGDS